MQKRFVSLWFQYLLTDWAVIRKPELKDRPLVVAASERNRLVIQAANPMAEAEGIGAGTTVADAKAVIPSLEVQNEIPETAARLLKKAGEWCIRYSPAVASDHCSGLMIDASGCTHLWGGEAAYLQTILKALRDKGYQVRGAIADTPGAAWALARFGKNGQIVPSGEQIHALLTLPPAALRLEPETLERLQKLGFYSIQKLLGLPRSALRRRFGEQLLLRLDQALGQQDEPLLLLQPVEPYHVRLPFLEPIRTAPAIEQAIVKLLEMLCLRLQKEGKGLRMAVLKGFRVDGKTLTAGIGTNRPSAQVSHLFKLFELKIPQIEPALGIELFTLEAPKVEDLSSEQEALWASKECGLEHNALTELLDRIANKLGAESIKRYLPQERYWPEQSIRMARSLSEKPTSPWRTGKRRPSLLLPKPERIEVSALLPDNPPMLFIYKGKRHIVKKADDAERIEREWWQDQGLHRDYYIVEDEEGCRYWLFRSGHYDGQQSQWYLHGFFA